MTALEETQDNEECSSFEVINSSDENKSPNEEYSSFEVIQSSDQNESSEEYSSFEVIHSSDQNASPEETQNDDPLVPIADSRMSPPRLDQVLAEDILDANEAPPNEFPSNESPMESSDVPEDMNEMQTPPEENSHSGSAEKNPEFGDMNDTRDDVSDRTSEENEFSQESPKNVGQNPPCLDQVLTEEILDPNEAPYNEISTNDVPTNEMPTSNVSNNDVSSNESPKESSVPDDEMQTSPEENSQSENAERSPDLGDMNDTRDDIRDHTSEENEFDQESPGNVGPNIEDAENDPDSSNADNDPNTSNVEKSASDENELEVDPNAETEIENESDEVPDVPDQAGQEQNDSSGSNSSATTTSSLTITTSSSSTDSSSSSSIAFESVTVTNHLKKVTCMGIKQNASLFLAGVLKSVTKCVLGSMTNVVHSVNEHDVKAALRANEEIRFLTKDCLINIVQMAADDPI